MVKQILHPAGVREALRLGRLPGAAWLGGGTWLNGPGEASASAPGEVSASSPGGGAPRILVSLDRLGLDRVERAGAGCTVGAAVTLQRLIDSPDVPEAVRRAAVLTAARTLRNMASLGGELGLRPYDSVLIPVLLALDAEVLTADRRAPRSMEEHLRAPEASLVLGIRLADPRPCAVEVVSLSSRGRRSLVVAVGLRGGAGAPLSGVRLAAGDCTAPAQRLRPVEEALEGRPLPSREAVEKAVHDAFWPNPDARASGAYKRYMAAVLAADMVHALAGGAP